jgi:hypothetical protein
MPDASTPVTSGGADAEISTGGTRMRRWVSTWRGFLLLSLLYLLAYGQTLGFGFVWDDPSNFAASPLMHGPLSGVIRKGEAVRADPAIARMPKDLVPQHESFRPVSVLSHWLDVRLLGDHPGLMHLHSILLGLLSILLVQLLARRLGLGWWLPALWALHPLHVEVFAYLSGRSDLLAGIASLGASLLAMRSTEARPGRARWSWAAAAAIAHLLSLFAKEGNLGLPFAFLALAIARTELRASIASLLAMLLATAAYFPARSLLQEAGALPTAQTAAILKSFVDCPGVVLGYLGGFILPFSLSPDKQLWRPLVPLGWGVLAVLALGLGLGWRRLPARVKPDVRLGAGALVALGPLLLPAALGVRSIGALSDRYAFFPLLFIAIAALALARALGSALHALPRAWAVVPAALWAVILLATTWLQIGVWRNDETLARYAARIEPDNSAALFRLATVATKRGQFARARPLLERAVALNPENKPALNNLAVAYVNLGRIADAKAVLRRLAPLARATDKRYWFNVASVQVADHKLDKACGALEQALKIDPGYPLALALRKQVCSASPAPSAARPANPGPRPHP